MQPINYSIGLGAAKDGYNLATGIRDDFQKQQLLGQQREQVELEKVKMAELKTKMAQAYEADDIEALHLLSLENPEMSKMMIGAVNEKAGMKEGELATLAKTLAFNPDSAETVLTEKIQEVQRQGGDPTQFVEMLVEYRDPAKREQFIKNTEDLFAMTADKDTFEQYRTHKGIQDPMTAYQQEQITQSKAEFDFEKQMKREEIQLKRLEMQAKREGDAAKKAETQAKIDAKKVELDEKKAEQGVNINNSINVTKESMQTVDDLLSNDEFLDDLTGLSGVAQGFGLRPTEDAREAQILFDAITNEKTLENLSRMSGPLTDTDVAIIAKASNKIREGMSKPQMKVELQKIKRSYERIIKQNEDKAKRLGLPLDSNKTPSIEKKSNWSDLP